VRRIVGRAPGLRIEALEGVLIDEWLAGDEVDPVIGLLQHPQIAVSRWMYQGVDHLAVVLHVHQHGRTHLVPVPGIVVVILVIGLDLPVVRVERDGGAGVEIIARMEVARPRGGVADTPIG
jgi:hypothetical protein